MGFLFFAIFLFYGAAFYFGGYLRWNKVEENGTIYTGGKVICIMFTVIFGAFNLGAAAPHIKALTEARIAGKLAFDVIDKPVQVNPNDKGE